MVLAMVMVMVVMVVAMVMDDGILTENEQKLLKLQAKNLGLNQARVEYLDTWYTESLVSSSEEE